MYSGVPMAPVRWEAEKVSQMRATPEVRQSGHNGLGHLPSRGDTDDDSQPGRRPGWDGS